MRCILIKNLIIFPGGNKGNNNAGENRTAPAPGIIFSVKDFSEAKGRVYFTGELPGEQSIRAGRAYAFFTDRGECVGRGVMRTLEQAQANSNWTDVGSELCDGSLQLRASFDACSRAKDVAYLIREPVGVNSFDEAFVRMAERDGVRIQSRFYDYKLLQDDKPLHDSFIACVEEFDPDTGTMYAKMLGKEPGSRHTFWLYRRGEPARPLRMKRLVIRKNDRAEITVWDHDIVPGAGDLVCNLQLTPELTLCCDHPYSWQYALSVKKV